MTTPASKLLQPITVGPLELKNRIMFPPLTTGYEESDGSIGKRSLAFYERLARGGVSYIVIGDVAPVMTASPTPKLATDAQIPTFKALADAVHKHGAKVALQLFHPEYDVPGVGRMVMGSMAAAKAAQEAKAAGDEETFAAKMAESNEIRNQAYAKLHHDMQHFVNEASVEQLTQIKEAIAASAARAQQAGIDAIEVHGDRLVGSLCSAILNKRTDEYGGSFENRVRYALEVVAEGETYKAKLVGTDPSSDLAVIKVDGATLKPIEIGNSSDLKVGEWVMAAGSPFGMEQSVSTGIVSAVNRSYADSESGAIYTNMIQTDAAINSGNSGGALVDAEGKLIGINTLIMSTSGTSSGVGFAIPVDYAFGIAEQLIQGKTPSHAQLGVSLITVNNELAQRFGIQATEGAYINSLTAGGAAAKAGLQEGDVILKVDGESITSSSDLVLAIRSHSPNDEVDVTYLRDGKEETTKVKLGADTQ